MISPTEQIDRYFAADRATWKLLSLQTRLRQAKSPQTRAQIVQAIENQIRSMALIYTGVHTEGYRAGVQFGKENAAYYASVERYQQRSPNQRIEVRTVDRRPVTVVNGRSID